MATASGLTAKVNADLGAVAYDHIAQTNESDLHFLTRLAKDQGAVIKPANGYLVIAKAGEAKSATGQSLAQTTLSVVDLSRWSATLAERKAYKTCKAFWQDINSGKRKPVKAGSGEPELQLKRIYWSMDLAQRAAQAALKSGKYGKITLSASLPERSDIQAEAPLFISDLPSDLPQNWRITRVDHSLSSSGYTTSLEAEDKTDSAS